MRPLILVTGTRMLLEAKRNEMQSVFTGTDIDYSDALGSPKAGVPPESIWVNTVAQSGGNLRVNDQGETGSSGFGVGENVTRS